MSITPIGASQKKSTYLRRIGGIVLLSLGLCASVNAAEPETDDDTQQTLVTVDDFAVTNLHFALFASQTGRNPSDTAGQIDLLNELINHFMVANSPQGKALAGRPEVAAALEVARARLLAQTFVRAQLEEIKIDEAALRARYAERQASPHEEYKARHILLASEDDAKAVILALDQGADFATLASEKSTGPSKTSGGDLGWFEPEQMVPEFAAATQALSNGDYSKQPVKTQFGWHVILREDSRAVPQPTFDEMRDELTREIQQERIAAAIDAIREQTEITVHAPDE